MFLFLTSALFIFGPSCGGKSTLAQALVEQLGSPWVYLDRDRLIEEEFCSEELADQALEERVAAYQAQSQKVVIDAQIPWRAPKNEEVYVLVYAPLPVLMARDERRNVRLERSAKRAHYARLYVEKTYSEVFRAPVQLDFCYDLILDSSANSIAAEIQEISHLLVR